MMGQKPNSGFKRVLLVWLIGLALGIAAGAATAYLLMPVSDPLPPGASLADRLGE